MAVVEIPTHVCHIVGSKICGATAIIGSDCPHDPLWKALPCVDIDAPLVPCAPQSLMLTASVPISLPLVPVYEEAP